MGSHIHELIKVKRYASFNFKQIVCSWDTAFKEEELNDPSACTIWGVTKNGYYLLWVINKRLNYPKLYRETVKQWKNMMKDFKFGSSKVPILIEDKASGQSLIQDLKTNTTMPIISIKTKGSKVVRFDDVTRTIEAGNVIFPDTDAPWLVETETQLCRFPYDKHDDIVDSISQFLKWIERPRFVPGRNLKLWK